MKVRALTKSDFSKGMTLYRALVGGQDLASAEWRRAPKRRVL